MPKYIHEFRPSCSKSWPIHRPVSYTHLDVYKRQKYAPSYLIENGDYPQTYKINGTNYRWDAKQTVFYPNSSRTVQYTLDKAGFIKVMRYVKAGASDVLTNILDKKAVESSNNRVVVLRDSEGKFVTNFYIDRNTEFIDETGRSMGFDHWGLEKFNAIYGDGQVEVVANGRFASIVRGLRTEKACLLYTSRCV